MPQHTASHAAARFSPARGTALTAPRPAPRPVERTLFGDTTPIPYRWLRDRGSAEVAEHFAAENSYTDRHTAHHEPLRARLRTAVEAMTPSAEQASRLGPSAPVLVDGWWYIDRDHPADGATFSRVRDGAEVRGPAGVPEIVPGTLLEGEQILIPECVGVIAVAISPDHRLIARAEAAIGGCRVIVTEAASGEEVDSSLHGAGPDLVFSADSRALLYTALDGHGRRHQVRCHRLGGSPAEDLVVLEEPDHWAHLAMSRSRDGSSVLIRAFSPSGSEVWIGDLAAPDQAPRSLTGRLPDVQLEVEHAGDRLLVLREDPATHRTLLHEAPLDISGALPEGPELLAPAEGEHFESLEAFASAIALQVRHGGVPELRVIPRRADGSLDLERIQVVGRGGELDAIRLEPTPTWEARTLRYRRDSFVTPPEILEHDLATGTSGALLSSVPSGFDAGRFVERRLWATSADGTQVPISLFARHDVPADGTAPCILFGDGAFARSTDPRLRPESLALAEHGVVIAIAHVRGGGEMGPEWHRQGRGLSKANSLDDFVACADHLVSTGWAAEDRLGAVGLGAGALLVGAAANRAPERFRALVAGTPLVDPLETLQDEDVMLTLEQWIEWGDPVGEEANYHAMRSYSPAENIRETEYPAIYAWTAQEGPDAPAACAAIWVAQLRDRVTSDPTLRPILLRSVPSLAASAGPQIESMAWILEQLGAVTLGE